MKKQFCISERPFGGDSQRDEKMVGRHCSKIQEDGDTEFFPASHQVRRGLEAWGGAGHRQRRTLLCSGSPKGPSEGIGGFQGIRSTSFP